MLTRDDFLKYKLKTSVIELPELGDQAMVRELTGEQRFETEFKSMSAKNDIEEYRTIRALTTIHALVDEDENPIFTMADLEFVQSLPSSIHQKIETEVMRLSNISQQEVVDTAKKSTASQES